MYTCGPTVYNYAHIGNARPAVVSDLLVRILRILFPKVTYVSNITDIDDKIIKASDETGVPISDITRKYEKIYNEDMQALLESLDIGLDRVTGTSIPSTDNILSSPLFSYV